LTTQWIVSICGEAPEGADTREFREKIVASALKVGWPSPNSDGCAGNSFHLGWTVDAFATETTGFIGTLLHPDTGIGLSQLTIDRVDDESPTPLHDDLSEKYKVIVSALSAGAKHRRPMSHPEWSSVTEW
jgi:hypothetical protein